MYDRFERPITYLRISVTDKCNLRCRYCMPPEGVPKRRHEDLLSLESLAEAARAAVALGVTKIRLTGGEPLVRRGIVNLVRMIAAIEGLEDLGMTTNGTLLAPRARELKDAGLGSVNISLDTLIPERYAEITRGGSIHAALEGIRAAGAAGLPVKINMVVLADTTAEEIDAMRDYCSSIAARLQLINHFDLTRQKGEQDAAAGGRRNAEAGGRRNAEAGDRRNAAGSSDRGRYSFDRPPPCAGCNRIRLLADGTLKPCLHSDKEVRLDPARITESLREAILAKPRHGGACISRSMRQIGG